MGRKEDRKSTQRMGEADFNKRSQELPQTHNDFSREASHYLERQYGYRISLGTWS
jgi:hypothetical protein